MNRARYFDNAATTPVDPRVVHEMLPFLEEDFGNASSIHAAGARAHEAVELARQRVASLLDAEDPQQIVFTSGATEANNWVLAGFSDAAVSPFEHSAVHEPALARGFDILPNREVEILPPDRRYELISLMTVNNEIGTVWRPQAFREFAESLHSDLTQQLGKLPIDLEGIDYASMSAHKLYGPKGVGALYFAETSPSPYMRGGEQENGVRAGTYNVPGIVGFGAACAIAEDELEENLRHVRTLRETFLNSLSPLSGWSINGGQETSHYVLSVSFEHVEGETLVIEADRRGFAISAGAACSSRSTEPSHVLTALGLEESKRRGTVRISFSKFNTLDATHDLATSLLQSVEKLRTIS